MIGLSSLRCMKPLPQRRVPLAGIDFPHRHPQRLLGADQNYQLLASGGFQVAHRLRESGALKIARLIAMTGYGQEDDRQRNEEAGFGYHLTKPVNFAQLQELLRTGS